jgi:predicted DNA-binding protein
MLNKDTRFPSVRTSAEQVERLNRAAELLDKPISELVRRAIEKELATLAKRFPELKKAA